MNVPANAVPSVMMLELREVLRSMMLPISPQNEKDCVSECHRHLTDQHIDDADQPGWLRLELDNWQMAGSPSAELLAMIKMVLAQGDADFGVQLRSNYLALHSSLQEKHLLSHSEASAFLSHSLLILRLAAFERMSASQISRVLAVRDTRQEFSWRAVQTFLTRFRQQPTLDIDKVRDPLEADTGLEVEAFADADTADASQTVSDIGVELGLPGDLNGALSCLVSDSAATFGPYLQILHYQCSIAEWFDHPLTYAYEFNPRGDSATWLFEKYPSILSGAKNPFLNNAKAVERLDLSWAESKKSRQLAQARALAEILIGMENLSFAAKRELAGWLRKWILLVIRISTPLQYQLPDMLTPAQIENVINAVRTAPTGTWGIIEQRVTDLGATLLHPKDQNWRGRGIGDSVNATNISRRKLGDCDFQDTAARKVVAYESHGGKLTEVYLREHHRTLERSMKLRAEEEWAGVADPQEWKVDLLFIAHEVADSIKDPIQWDIQGTEISVRCTTFGAFLGQLTIDAALVDTFNRLVVGRFNATNTPDPVRRALANMAGI